MPVGVVTDSTCDLPVATLKRARVVAVPLWIHVGDERYRDWRDLEPGTAFEWMNNQGIVPLVRSPSIEDFMTAFDGALQEHEQLLSVHVASRFSNTYAHAAEAVRRLGANEHIALVDSGTVGPGLAELVLGAARLARQGASLSELTGTVEALKGSINGYISPTAAGWGRSDGVFGSLGARRRRSLGHRPVIGLREGELSTLVWTPDRKVADLLVSAVAARYGTREISIAVSHTGPGQGGLVRIQEAVERSGLRVVHGRLQLMGAALSARLGLGSASLFARPVD